MYARPAGTFLRSRRLALAGPRLRSATRGLLRPFLDYFFAAALRRPATVRRGPFRMRAFVRVRCP